MPFGRDRRQRRRRLAVLGGAAVAAKKHYDAKQAEQEQVAAPKPAGPPGVATEPAVGGMTPQVLAELKQLGELHETGVLTDEEFAGQKAKLLGPT
jgi:hypothetical protein